MIVLLPAPFSPSSARTSPLRICMETSWLAMTLAKYLLILLSSTNGGADKLPNPSWQDAAGG